MKTQQQFIVPNYLSEDIHVVFLFHLTPIDPFKILHTGPLSILIFVGQSPDSPGSGLGGGSLGLLLGVCTLQILMKPAMSMMRAMPISNTAHQWACRGGGAHTHTQVNHNQH